MLLSFLVVLVVLLASGDWGRLNGDYDFICRATGTAYPTNWRMLVDTNDYQNLYDPFNSPQPPWIVRSFDSDSLTWDQTTALVGSCNWQMRSCQFCSGPQDNWLFSQYISYEEAND